jgi:hypothetical protein
LNKQRFSFLAVFAVIIVIGGFSEPSYGRDVRLPRAVFTPNSAYYCWCSKQWRLPNDTLWGLRLVTSRVRAFSRFSCISTRSSRGFLLLWSWITGLLWAGFWCEQISNSVSDWMFSACNMILESTRVWRFSTRLFFTCGDLFLIRFDLLPTSAYNLISFIQIFNWALTTIESRDRTFTNIFLFFKIDKKYFLEFASRNFSTLLNFANPIIKVCKTSLCLRFI